MLQLIKFNDTHAENTFEWMQDESLKKSFLLDRVITRESHERWHQNYKQNQQEEIYGIVYENVHIGNIGWKNIDLNALSAEHWFYFGENRFKGKGLATKSLLQFQELAKGRFHKLYCYIAQKNVPSVKSHLSAGFTIEGYLKDHIKFQDEYYDFFRFAFFPNA